MDPDTLLHTLLAIREGAAEDHEQEDTAIDALTQALGEQEEEGPDHSP